MAMRKVLPLASPQPTAAAASTDDKSSKFTPGNTDDADINLDGVSHSQFNGPSLISFDGDQTLYSDGQNFEANQELAFYMYQLLRCGVHVAVVTAAGYDYEVEKYEFRLSGLLQYFKAHGLTEDESRRFYLFGGECNYLLQLSDDYRLHPVKEIGPGGWLTSTRFIDEAPGNWKESEVDQLLDVAEAQFTKTLEELNLRGRVIRKRRSVGLVPIPDQGITRESLDETILRAHEALGRLDNGNGPKLPFCAFNGGGDCWVDVGNKRVGVRILQAYLGVANDETLHIGDLFLNTGNDFAARDVSPCIWIISPLETTYILKSILRLAGISLRLLKHEQPEKDDMSATLIVTETLPQEQSEATGIDFEELERRAEAAKRMDVYTGEFSMP
jgi:IMP and pyridine-specific 5'-nucleotidase